VAGEQGDLVERGDAAGRHFCGTDQGGGGRRGAQSRADENGCELPGSGVRAGPTCRLLGGKTIHYYELGAIKVAPGNEVIPLWTVTSCARGQRNIAENIVPGTTAYPPLWAIVEVTWNGGVTPRVLKSLAEIKKAEAGGEVRLTKTSLVVNCPLV
jgi:hypothetical protein